MTKLEITENQIVIFTDGSSRGNPGPGGYGTVVVYTNGKGEVCIDELGGREDETTNNRMELKAVIEGLKYFIGYYDNLPQYTFTVYLDSAYVQNGLTKWVPSWKKKGWKTGTNEEVKNQDLWIELSEITDDLSVKLIRLPGHAGVCGNERCDEIATAYADNRPVPLYKGKILEYSLAEKILDISVQQTQLEKKKKSGSKIKAYSYVSLVDGKINIDKNWKDCEDRVKGKSGARFKKSVSPIDEDLIVKEFLK